MTDPRRLGRAGVGICAVMAAVAVMQSCQTEYSYTAVTVDRVDIHEVVECDFQPTTDGFEQYSCVPVFSNKDPGTGEWERAAIGDFDIVQREVFGAPFYQMWYSGRAGDGPNDGEHVGYAVSMDGVDWIRHSWNPVLRRGTSPGSFDRDDAKVACVAFDGDAGVYHLWYTGTNSGGVGTTFGHATSRDGVMWDKDLLNPLDPFEDTGSALSRVWGCDALFEAGSFHFWAGGINWKRGLVSQEEFLESAKYDIAYLSTSDGATFQGGGDLVLEHAGLGGDGFDAEGVHKPSVFVFGDEDSTDPRYWMLYAGYQDVVAAPDGTNGLININASGQRLGMANSYFAEEGWQKLSSDPVPLDFSGADTADSPRAFFINGRLHVFFTDEFIDPLDGTTISGIGLGISPFPIAEESQ